MIRILSTLILAFTLTGHAIASTQEVRIGVLAFRGVEKTKMMWQPTADYLSHSLPGHRFKIVPLTNNNISEQVALGKLNFVLTNPASYAGLEARFGITRIATLNNRRLGGIYTRFGALIFTRADNKDINTISDLRGKVFMAVHKNAFGGWWMAWRELREHGFSPETDFKKMVFSGFPQDQIVYAVRDGKVDAGTVRTDLLEQMAAAGKINVSDFKVINPVETVSFPFSHSTRLYPEWPFSVARGTSGELAQNVAIALLRLPANSKVAMAANSAGWTVPLDYSSVHEMMKELRVGHYKDFGKISTAELLRQYASWIITIFISLMALAGVVLYMKRLNSSLSQSKENLELEIAKRLLAQKAEHRQAERIRELYEAASIPGLTTEAQLAEMLRLGCRLLDMEIGKLCRIDEIKDRVYTTSIIAPKNMRDQFSQEAPLKDTFCAILYGRHKPLALNNVSESEFNNHPAHLSSGLEAYIGCPIWVNGNKYGTIHFSSRRNHTPFDETDTNLVKLMSRWVSVRLERQFALEQLKESKLVAESANQAKSMFLANMSHELRTPLNAIIGYSEMLREDIADFGVQQHIVDIDNISFAGKHLLQLINNILDLSKIESGKVELNIETIQVDVFINEMASTIEPLVQKNRNEFAITITDGVDTMRTDALKLRQVLLNVVGNACKFTEQGTITIDVSRKVVKGNNLIEFLVGDNGIGIPKSAMDNLFQEFVQVDNSITRKFDGTGLGLTISRRLCYLLGGEITAKSEHNKGSKFYVTVSAEGPPSSL